jgi:hypothetical protein
VTLKKSDLFNLAGKEQKNQIPPIDFSRLVLNFKLSAGQLEQLNETVLTPKASEG